MLASLPLSQSAQAKCTLEVVSQITLFSIGNPFSFYLVYSFQPSSFSPLIPSLLYQSPLPHLLNICVSLISFFVVDQLLSSIVMVHRKTKNKVRLIFKPCNQYQLDKCLQNTMGYPIVYLVLILQKTKNFFKLGFREC